MGSNPILSAIFVPQGSGLFFVQQGYGFIFVVQNSRFFEALPLIFAPLKETLGQYYIPWCYFPPARPRIVSGHEQRPRLVGAGGENPAREGKSLSGLSN